MYADKNLPTAKCMSCLLSQYSQTQLPLKEESDCQRSPSGDQQEKPEEQAEIGEELRKKNEFLCKVLESFPYPFFVIDIHDYTVKLANSAAGFGELQPESKCYRLTHNSYKPCSGQDCLCPIDEIKRTQKPIITEHAHYNNEGKAIYNEVHAFPFFDQNGDLTDIIECTVDITERKQLEAQLLHAQKMESIGRLAGGVAHEFNNILTVILGYSQLVQLTLPDDHPLQKDMTLIKSSGERAAVLTKKLLNFCRKQVLDIQVLNLNPILENFGKFIKRLIGEHIDLKLKINSSISCIKADPGQMEQVLINLVVNAKDAMPQGGTLVIKTCETALSEEFIKDHKEIIPGKYVRLSVTDNGKGMDRVQQEKVFEPFFTTKGPQGTGLGLAIVYDIVKQHGGYIYLESKPDCETTFNLYFPITEAKDKLRFTKQQVSNSLEGTEMIFVVEDDASIRRLIGDHLQSLGYRVQTYPCGTDALKAIEISREKLDVLLTDVLMPGLNGPALAEKAAELQPDIKVLFMSGYTDDVLCQYGLSNGDSNFIQKPLSLLKLVHKIRKILNQTK